ncbi:hypothetical protein BDZ45DRAFT_752451 [Acephala macrosclerotiorum]|nr:hypothetical protein BDZ45DRAFT_752451 [Acephala macrosclerotiorum]
MSGFTPNMWSAQPTHDLAPKPRHKNSQLSQPVNAEAVFTRLVEAHQEANKLFIESTTLATDFHPHDHRILDLLSRRYPKLRWNIPQRQTERGGLRVKFNGIRISQGQLPQTENLFMPADDNSKCLGSLIVCLTHPHKGSQLKVSKDGQSVFNWSDTPESTPSSSETTLGRRRAQVLLRYDLSSPIAVVPSSLTPPCVTQPCFRSTVPSLRQWVRRISQNHWLLHKDLGNSFPPLRLDRTFAQKQQ